MAGEVTTCTVTSNLFNTISVVETIQFRWSVGEYSRPGRYSHEQYTSALARSSPRFCGEGSSLIWFAQLSGSPRASDSDDNDLHVVVKLEYNSSTSFTTQAAVTTCIYGRDNVKIPGSKYTEFPTEFSPVGAGGIKSKLTTTEKLFSDTNHHLSNNHLTIGVTVYYLKHTVSRRVSSVACTPELVAGLPGVPALETMSSVEEMLRNKQYSDVTLVAGNGTSGEREFLAHRLVLAARSPVFKAMFDVEMKEKRQHRVRIEDMSAEIVSDLITFIYTDTAPNISTLAPELLMAAEKYDIPRLHVKAVCEQELAGNLTEENIVNVLDLADSYRAPQLRLAVLNWITMNAGKVESREDWIKLSTERPHLIQEAFSMLAKWQEKLLASHYLQI